MGQATLDLPDPMQEADPASPTAPAALASADDLLSQLAGDDIDRLLAEAHAEQDSGKKRAPAPISLPHAEAQVEPAPEPVAQAATEQAPVAVEPDQAALDALFTELNSQPAPAVSATPPIAEPRVPSVPIQPTAAMEADLEALDKALAESAPEALAAADLAPEPSAAPARVDAATEIAAELDASEKKALAEAIAPPEPAPEPKVEEHAPAPAAEPKAERPSILVKVLEFANYPLLACSDAVREAVGKVALLTLFNAIAVLVYVILFRKHPHH